MGQKNTVPLFLSSILRAGATMPWENSCTNAMIKIAMIQYQNGNTPNPGTLIPGRTNETPDTAAGLVTKSTKFLMRTYEITNNPTYPAPTPIYPSKMTHSRNFLEYLSIHCRPHLVR